MFKLSRRKGASVGQVRKRWPLDCAPNLRGEFVRTTGETARERAADMLPTIAAEFRAKVNEARAQVQKFPERALTETTSRRMAADFYRSMLPSFTVRTRLEPVHHAEVLKIAQDNLKASLGMLGANRYDPVYGAARTMMAKAGIAADENSQELEFFQHMLMRACRFRASLDGVPTPAPAILGADLQIGASVEGQANKLGIKKKGTSS